MNTEETGISMNDISKRENTTALAFIGDAVFELHIRAYVMKKGIKDADRMHRETVKYVRAESQAETAKYLLNGEGLLSDEEEALLKRARNKKSTSKSRSAGPVSYKLATAFEALVGGLYMAGSEERCREIMDTAIDIREGRVGRLEQSR